MAGAEGFEPPVPGPKPGALPLGDAPLLSIEISVIIQILHYYDTLLSHCLQLLGAFLN